MNSFRNINKQKIVCKKNQIKLKIYDKYIRIHLFYVKLFKLFEVGV